MDELCFFVEGTPKPQNRPRTFQRKDGRTVTWASTDRVRAWRDCIHLVAQRHSPKVPWDGPVWVRLEFNFSRPKSHYKKDGTLSAEGRRRPCPMGGVGDWDNLGKAVTDAIEGTFWHNDNQVVSCDVRKKYLVRGIEGVTISLGRIIQ